MGRIGAPPAVIAENERTENGVMEYWSGGRAKQIQRKQDL
jgi:hypothetical protein